MGSIEVYAVGSSVTVGPDIAAKVTGINIRNKCHVTHEVSYWDGTSHVCKWFESLEVSWTEGA